MRNFAPIILFAMMPFGLTAGVNTIYLKDGRTLSGRLTNGNQDFVNFQDDNGNQYRFRINEVDSINFAAQDGNGNNRGFSNNRNPSDRDRAYNNGNYSNSQNNNGIRTLNTGTELSIRTTSTINSKQANDGQVFPATVDKDVTDQNGNVVIPRGSNADLVIRSTNGGSIRTSSNLVLDVQSVTVNGQRFLVNTEDLEKAGRQGVGGNKRTAEIVGGGTALGTILGAIGGGGKGALIGALAGAAAGTGVQVLTKGSEVSVPSESVLTFRLDQPMTLNPSR